MTKRKIETDAGTNDDGKVGGAEASSTGPEIKRSRVNCPEEEDSKMSPVSWGEWMGSWKASEGEVDAEQERIDRQKVRYPCGWLPPPNRAFTEFLR